MNVVINADFGGFSLSKKAELELLKAGWPGVSEVEPSSYYGGPNWAENFKRDREDPDTVTTFSPSGFPVVMSARTASTPGEGALLAKLRSDPRLVQVIAEMGVNSSGPHASLRVVQWPDTVPFEIVEHDGKETLRIPEWIATTTYGRSPGKMVDHLEIVALRAQLDAAKGALDAHVRVLESSRSETNRLASCLLILGYVADGVPEAIRDFAQTAYASPGVPDAPDCRDVAEAMEDANALEELCALARAFDPDTRSRRAGTSAELLDQLVEDARSIGVMRERSLRPDRRIEDAQPYVRNVAALVAELRARQATEPIYERLLELAAARARRTSEMGEKVSA